MSFGGTPTRVDVLALLKAKNYQVTQLGRAFFEIQTEWAARDRASYDDFLADYNALVSRWTKARDDETDRFYVLPIEIAPALDGWNHLMHAVRQAWRDELPNPPPDQTPPVTKGDLQDLNDRLTAAGGKPDYSNTPQPDARDDFDLRIFKAAGVILDTTKTAGGWGLALGLALLVLAISRK